MHMCSTAQKHQLQSYYCIYACDVQNFLFPHFLLRIGMQSEVLIMPLRLAKITKHQDQMAPVATLWQCEPAVDALQVWLKYITHIQIKQPEPVKSNLVTKI